MVNIKVKDVKDFLLLYGVNWNGLWFMPNGQEILAKDEDFLEYKKQYFLNENGLVNEIIVSKNSFMFWGTITINNTNEWFTDVDLSTSWKEYLKNIDDKNKNIGIEHSF